METKQLIETYYNAFNAADWKKFLSLLDENVIHDVNQGGREVGKAKFSAFMEVMDAHYKEQVKELVVMVSQDGKRAAAEFFIDGIYTKTQKGLPEAKGQKYWLPVGAFFAIEKGKITRISNHYNLQDWIKQVS